MDEVARSLLNMYEKHKEYLEKQVEMHSYLNGKLNDTMKHKFQHDAYVSALDNLNTLFGECA